MHIRTILENILNIKFKVLIKFNTSKTGNTCSKILIFEKSKNSLEKSCYRYTHHFVGNLMVNPLVVLDSHETHYLVRYIKFNT